jgi:hypothetical protein
VGASLDSPVVPKGAGSCSAAACHGAPDRKPGGVLRNEYSTWIAQDKHARAYQVLFSARSQSIARNLARRSTAVIPAHQDSRCLACHATPSLDPGGEAMASIRQDGVGCESCHGSAQRWLGEHTTYLWRSYSPEEKEERFGVIATPHLARRALACAGCHVGAPAEEGKTRRDVDHDLIAAGHPRLNFEFSAYLANMPAHWVEKGRNTNADFSARTWAIGQIVSARAALALLKDRAERAAPSSGQASSPTWPEFSEYYCFSCHHDLRDEPWRRERAIADHLPGSPAWGTWYFSLIPKIAEPDQAGASALSETLRDLKAQMERPAPDARAISARVNTMGERLDRSLSLISHEPLGPELVARWIRSISPVDAEGRQAGVSTWDHAAQAYLALVSLRQSLLKQAPAQVDPQLENNLERLLQQVTYPPDRDSPSGFDPNTFGRRP